MQGNIFDNNNGNQKIEIFRWHKMFRILIRHKYYKCVNNGFNLLIVMVEMRAAWIV